MVRMVSAVRFRRGAPRTGYQWKRWSVWRLGRLDGGTLVVFAFGVGWTGRTLLRVHDRHYLIGLCQADAFLPVHGTTIKRLDGAVAGGKAGWLPSRQGSHAPAPSRDGVAGARSRRPHEFGAGSGAACCFGVQTVTTRSAATVISANSLGLMNRAPFLRSSSSETPRAFPHSPHT
jgi:hypothetical protein